MKKKVLRETQILRAGCSKAEIKKFAPPQTPFPWSRAAAPAGFQARVGKIRRKAPKKNSFAHPGFQFAYPAIRNGCPPCPPYRGGFKGKGLVGY